MKWVLRIVNVVQGECGASAADERILRMAFHKSGIRLRIPQIDDVDCCHCAGVGCRTTIVQGRYDWQYEDERRMVGRDVCHLAGAVYCRMLLGRSDDVGMDNRSAILSARHRRLDDKERDRLVIRQNRDGICR